MLTTQIMYDSRTGLERDWKCACVWKSKVHGFPFWESGILFWSPVSRLGPIFQVASLFQPGIESMTFRAWLLIINFLFTFESDLIDFFLEEEPILVHFKLKCQKLMLRNRCGSNYCLFRDVVTRRDHMKRVFVTGASSKRENSTHGAFSLSDKIVADKFRISLKEFTTKAFKCIIPCPHISGYFWIHRLFINMSLCQSPFLSKIGLIFTLPSPSSFSSLWALSHLWIMRNWLVTDSTVRFLASWYLDVFASSLHRHAIYFRQSRTLNKLHMSATWN